MGKIAVIIGSPRANGNTRMLADAFVNGAKESNEVDVITLGSLHIGPCRGCNFCSRNEAHDCVQKDDMAGVIDRLTDADIIVIASPIYFYGVSAMMKTFIDRLHTPKRKNFRVKGLVLLCVAADTIPTLFDAVSVQFESILKYFSLKDCGRVFVNGVKDPGDIKGRPELKTAFDLGKSL